MVENVSLQNYHPNYNTIGVKSVSNSPIENKLSKVNFGKGVDNNISSMPISAPVSIRTTLNGKDENNKYTTIISNLDKTGRRVVDNLLKIGVLLNSQSDDNSTVLDNLYKIVTEPRAKGLDSTIILKDTIATIAYPYIITQQFGNIPESFRNIAEQANQDKNSSIDVSQSGTCVAASTEFKLANQNPAEFSRFAEGLSSEKMEVSKTLKLNNLADETLNAIWLLNAFDIDYNILDHFQTAKLIFKPDNNAIIRAQIQTVDKDKNERTPLDVLMQSTFMQVGSQQSYNTLTDKRSGKFNMNEKGLIEFEKTFTESVVFGKNILSVMYQKIDDNAKLVGYETDLETTKKHITQAIDEGENVLIGYTQTDANNVIINGHEITIVDYKTNKDGHVTFVCNDTDDNYSGAIEYPEEFIIPKIHHAALPKHIVESDISIKPSWVEGIEAFKEMKNVA